ncbi:cell wall-binding repeat-containing protein [Leifsonia poae]|uniref:Pyrrolo-quinoline quinone repeat domain-containing protein n=1 Tax=Leifsonia poae TaxID=110933 RepID=A0A9W6HCB9_9MICO|nr:cell wall-binding repeat-containing protein [Leifsonia poae]GLJ77439.1 hypothetical protein GCM10017584_30130 [Leifsonia poae]
MDETRTGTTPTEGLAERRWRGTASRTAAWAVITALALVAAGIPSAAVAASTSWLQYGNGPTHSGANAAETVLTPSTIGGLQKQYTATLPGIADSPPVYLAAASTPGGIKDLLFLTTKDGWTVAVDAATGSTLWKHQYGPGSCRINNGAQPCYTTSSPAVDPNGTSVYSYGLDGRVHKYAVGTGAETTGGGWPELATAKPYDEKSSPALTTASAGGHTYLYAANGGYPGDRGDYQGHVTTIDLATGTQKVFNTLCSDKTVHFTPANDCPQVQSAVWARPSVNYDPATNLIYFATGNSVFDGTHNWGDTVLALKPDGSGVGGGPVDSYTPSNQAALNSSDQDLGSSSPEIVAAPSGSAVKNLGVQGGKDAKLRLLDLSDLSSQGGPGHLGGELQLIAVPQGGQVLTQPAAWVDPASATPWVLVANNSGISGLKVVTGAGGRPQLSPVWKTAVAGTSPIVANGIGYYLTNGGVRAFEPTTGRLLWSDTSGTVGLHWQSPIVVNGHLYYADGSARLRAFGLPGAAHPVARVGGADRYAVSAALSAATFSPGVGTVYVSSGALFPDALSGGPAAGRAGGPLLLVQPKAIPSTIATELRRLHPAKIVVLGGAGSVSDGVKTSLGAFVSGGAAAVSRIGGSDRYAVSAGVSRLTTPVANPVLYVASGENYPDAVSGGAIAAGSAKGPLLLVHPTSIPSVIRAELGRVHPARIVVFGGTGSVSASVATALKAYTTGAVTRLGGADRYAASAQISGSVVTPAARVYVATGTVFADALSADPAAGTAKGPTLLVTPHGIPSAVAQALTRLRPSSIVIVGGTGSVDNAVQAALQAYIR